MVDGTTNIKIRVTHRRQQQYISTDLYCKPGLFQQGLVTGQDSAWINSRITDLLATYHHRYLKLGTVVNKMTSLELKEELMLDESISEIDFIQFAEKYIEKLKEQGRMGSVRGFRGVMMRLKEYRPHLNVSDITKSFLSGFEAYLRKSGGK